MRKSRFTESQVVSILKELDAGTTATELGRKHGIHANTSGRARAESYAGLESSDLVRLKQPEDESRRKDRIIAKLALEVDAMKELVEKTVGALAAAGRSESLARSRRLRGASVRVDWLHAQQPLLPEQAQR